MKVKVDQCCCGCTLRTGTILIAVYYIVSSSAAFAVCIFLISVVKHGTNNNNTVVTVNGTQIDSKGRIIRPEETISEIAVTGLTTVFAMYAIFSALSVLINVMLLVGAQKENLRLVYIWIVAHLIYLIVSVIGLISNLFMSLMNSSERAGSVGSTLLNIVLTFYFLVVVFSFHEQIKDRQQGIPPSGPPVVVYIDHQAAPPPYAELYPPWPQQGQHPPK